MQEVAETLEKQGMKEEAIEFYTQVRSALQTIPISLEVKDQVSTCQYLKVLAVPGWRLVRRGRADFRSK